ncbi:RNA-directed DNA polymerase, eukaryota, reverse transcriptase zinc-binding domain protein, partial [Tanacetum coccineum]
DLVLLQVDMAEVRIECTMNHTGSLNKTLCATHGTWANVVASIHALHTSDIIPNNTIWLKVGCGSLVRFWKDVWIGDNALNHWPIEGGKTDGKDSVFTVRETRKHIDKAILPLMDSSTRWNKFFPRKINVFMLRLSLDCLPHRFNLSRCGFDIDLILCPICLKTVETKDHVFSSCELAYDIWRLVRIWCDIFNSNLSSIATWLEWIDGLARASVKKERLYVITATTSGYNWKF